MSLDPSEIRKRFEPKEGKVVTVDRQMCTVRFSPCGKRLAAGGTDGTVRRWDVTADAPAELSPLKAHRGWVQSIAFHPDGRRLFTADSWGRLSAWPYAEPDPQPGWSVESAHDGWIRRVAISPDGKSLATCATDRKVCLWSADDGKKIREFLGHGDDVLAHAFHPDGRSLVSGDLKGVVKQWDLESGKLTRELDARVLYRLDRLQDIGGVRCLTFDPEGAVLACAGTQPKNGGNVQGTPTILLFDMKTGALKTTLKIGSDGDGYIFDLLWHREGFLMAVASGNPGAGKLLFQRPTDKEPFFMTTKMANCHSLDLHPNGTRLVVSATNANSNGNGRQLGKAKEYPGNWSPLHLWDLPTANG